jgi:ligand-binding sensor domain-containing protein
MGFSKNTVAKVVAASLVAASLFPVLVLQADDLDWVNITSFKTVRQMRSINDTVFVVTSGGVLAVMDFDEPGLTYTNLDGLGTSDLTDMIQDASGQRWLAGFGRLVKLDEVNGRQYLFFDIDDNLFRLNRIADDGDNLWVGTDLGLVLFSKTIDGGQIQDSYQLFDGLNPVPVVYDILLSDDSIWLATSSGLAVANRSDPQRLKSPLNWEGFSITDYSELETDTIINVVSYNFSIYVATRRGVHRMQTGIDTSFVPIPCEGLVRLHQMKKENDSIFVYYQGSGDGRIAVLVAADTSHVLASGLTSAALTGVGDGASRWLALLDGVYNDASGDFLEYVYTGMPGNDVSDITVNRDGVLTAGFRRDAIARFEDSVWIEHDLTLSQGSTVLISDSSGGAWMGTSGSALWYWNGDTLAHFNRDNSSLSGMGGTYVVVLGLATDGDCLYIASYRAANGYPVSVADLSNLDDLSGWDSIGVTEGLTDVAAVNVDLYQDQLAVATESKGVFVCNVGDDPFHTEITCRQFTRENSLLISNNARIVRYSPEGVLWVGTTFGLSRYDDGIDRFVDVQLPLGISSSVRWLEFDGRGNLWVGTGDGLVNVNAATGLTEVYSTLNSGIVHDEINSITFDHFTGNMYIGTSAGYSLIPSRMGQPTFDLAQVVAFPNPFVIDDANDRLSFNFGESGQVQIFTVAGELIRDTEVGTPWDGKNEKGKDVASGVYIFVITDRDGNIGRGKFLLVRQ